MPEKETIERGEKDKREGKAPSTQAGEFVREEIHHVREGKHGTRSPQQAIAIGLSKARQSGAKLPPRQKGTTFETTRRSAARAYEKGRRGTRRKPSPNRSPAVKAALKREGRGAASRQALSKHADSSAGRRTAASRSAAGKKASRTRGAGGRSAAARGAARTRAAK